MNKVKVTVTSPQTEELTKEELSAIATSTNQVTEDSTIEGTVHAPLAYAQDVDTLAERYPNLTINADKVGIKFADSEVERVLLASTSPKIDADGDGMITKEEAENVTSLPSFQGNTKIESFEELGLFNGVKRLSTSFFSGCSSLKAIDLSHITYMDGANTDWMSYGVFYNNQKLEYVKFNTTEEFEMKNNTFNSCVSLDNIDLEMCKYIGHATFYNCKTLKNFNSLNKVYSIGYGAFYGCDLSGVILNLPKLTELRRDIGGEYFPASYGTFANTNLKGVLNLGLITNMPSGNYDWGGRGSSIFALCTKLQFAVLPSTLQTMNHNQFYGCTSLDTIICKATTPPSQGTNNFYRCPLLHGIFVPSSSVDSYKEESGWSTYASKIFAIGGTEYQAAAQAAADEEGVTLPFSANNEFVFEYIYTAPKENNVPADFTPIEYIESANNTSLRDFQENVHTTDVFIARRYFVRYTSQYYSYISFFKCGTTFGGSVSKGGNGYDILYPPSQDNNYPLDQKIIDGDLEIVYDANVAKFIRNNTILHSTTFNTYKANATTNFGFRGKMYELTVFGRTSKNHIRLKPCIRKSDGKIGFYDVWNNKFYFDFSTEVTAGPVVQD